MKAAYLALRQAGKPAKVAIVAVMRKLLVLANALRMIVPGALLGMVLAAALSSVLQSLLFNLSAHDPAAFALATGLLILVALLATLIPGLAATRVNPTVALRCD